MASARAPGSRLLVRVVLLAALVALPLATLPAGSTAPTSLSIPLVAGTLHDVALLEPYDPRAPELAAQAPELARGIWTGKLQQSGGLVRLVEQGDQGLALADVGAGLAWFTLEEGRLVPLETPPEAEEIDTELRAPKARLGPEPAPAASSPRDGKLQLLMDADRTFTTAWNVAPQGAARGQLAIISLVDAIYRASLDVEIEVVEQHQRTTTGAYTGTILCDGSPDDLLRQFADAWEAQRPTMGDLREASIIFTSKPPAPHPSGGLLIGCGYLFELESPWAYSSARIPVPSNSVLQLTQDVSLVAHELGHNFGGLHHRAMPTPQGSLDVLRCRGATVMYPFLCSNAPVFSDTRGLEPSAGLLQLALEGGNAPWMESFAQSRI